jgi:hypothetical protein
MRRCLSSIDFVLLSCARCVCGGRSCAAFVRGQILSSVQMSIPGIAFVLRHHNSIFYVTTFAT